jgi:translation initiation factor IF-3
VTTSLLMNEQITAQELRVIDPDGNQLGILSRQDALYKAKSLGLDLIAIAPDASPPVCKILDGGKHLYEAKKREKEIARKQRASQIETKEIRLRPVTDKHDIQIKSKKAREFLDEGDKVRITVRFKGREADHKDIGLKVLEELMANLGEVKIEVPITNAGRDIFVLVTPQKE